VGEAPEANNAGREVERVPISEAATLLNVHPNTVRNRVKAGMYSAEKVVTERGPTWMIDRDSLITNTPTSDSQQLVSQRAVDFAQELIRPFVNELGEVREQLGVERALREQAESERDELRRELEQLPKRARPWWVLGLLVIVVVSTLVVLSVGAIFSPP
jgi:DNA-directed RNA polymerase specialized sigma24 family protein